LPLRQLKVGKEANLVLVVGSVRMELGCFRGGGDVGGYVLYDGRRATPRDVLAIALAGPFANLLGALVTGWLAMRYLHAAPWVAVALVVLTWGGLVMVDVNLRPKGFASDPKLWRDGLWARVAWRQRHHRGPLWRDPNEATSVPPPRVNGFHPRVDVHARPRPRESVVQVSQASGQAFKPQARKPQSRRAHRVAPAVTPSAHHGRHLPPGGGRFSS
jgi:hypothetical protein